MLGCIRQDAEETISTAKLCFASVLPSCNLSPTRPSHLHDDVSAYKAWQQAFKLQACDAGEHVTA